MAKQDFEAERGCVFAWGWAVTREFTVMVVYLFKEIVSELGEYVTTTTQPHKGPIGRSQSTRSLPSIQGRTGVVATGLSQYICEKQI